jgi:hypothetical protein
MVWLLPAIGALAGLLAVVLVVVAFANVRIALPTRSVEQSPITAAAPTLDADDVPPTIEPAMSPTPLPPTATTIAQSTASLTPGSTASASQTPSSLTPTPSAAGEYVRIANTDRQGAFIRREPRANAPGIVAYREGTVLRIVGPDTVVDGRPWRQVEDSRGNRGWTPREYLEPSPTGF